MGFRPRVASALYGDPLSKNSSPGFDFSFMSVPSGTLIHSEGTNTIQNDPQHPSPVFENHRCGSEGPGVCVPQGFGKKNGAETTFG